MVCKKAVPTACLRRRTAFYMERIWTNQLIKTKGSKLASQSRFCCLRPRPHETHQDQRQQTHLTS